MITPRPPYRPKPSPEVVAASKRLAIREALLELLIQEKKTEIIIQCGLRALDQILFMPEHMRTMGETFLEIAGCVIQVKRDFELDPWKIVYNGDVIFN
jgi:hypothetical protein